jgi:ATP-dependent DNA helicase
MPQVPLAITYIRDRADDYYTSLVGDLFDRMRENAAESAEWARLGNAFAQFVEDQAGLLTRSAISRSEAALYAAAAFYCGGFPASAYLSITQMRPVPEDGAVRACYDLLARPPVPGSQAVSSLLGALHEGNSQRLAQMRLDARDRAAAALTSGPDEWVPARLYQQLLQRFESTNLRAVLPQRPAGFWNPLVGSLISRTWEFFPSQIQAIRGGLLDDEASFTLQMPTGAGKTTLCETLLFDHLRQHPLDAAILLVPYRSLASELRGGLVRRLTTLGISSRCAYGGTVPKGDEVRNLQDTRLLVSTPEALSGLLGADRQFFRRISLVICDEGHLLGARSRGVSLELLLARLKGREGGAPRFVFISAIVPNVEEINAWLGGRRDSIIRSEYRPAPAEFAVLRERTSEGATLFDLTVHPHQPEPIRFTVEAFLSRTDFRFVNVATNRPKTLPFTSIKTRAVAAARKALPMGASVIFAANKRGNEGAIGIAHELLEQLLYPLALPAPLQFGHAAPVADVADYLRAEFGEDWIGTQLTAAGAILHHGDIPQETREVLEESLRRGDVSFAICTNTLAEGVNLPIRTLVLYSVERRDAGGKRDRLLSRDIKNLVGRAGRPGATTKGLVICANEAQWAAVERVAMKQPGENMISALRGLIHRLQRFLALQKPVLTNQYLEGLPPLHTLIDGIDSTLIDLAAEEITEERLVELAVALADQTFAAQGADEDSRELLRTVFRLRATRVAGVRTAGRIDWIRQTGARLRMLETVEADLVAQFAGWETLEDPVNEAFVDAMLQWSWEHGYLAGDIRRAYRLQPTDDVNSVRLSFFFAVRRWLAGDTYAQIAAACGTDVDDVLAVQTGAISFGLQIVVEQGIALLSRLLDSQGRAVAAAVEAFPDHLRFGVPTAGARALCNAGIRHRRAAILLGTRLEVQALVGADRRTLLEKVAQLFEVDEEGWRGRLGALIYQNTLADTRSQFAP